MRILGIDPGLTHTGWGVIEYNGFMLKKLACGVISSDASTPTAIRLANIHLALSELIKEFKPDVCSVEQVFVNMNPESSLKLGLARGVVLCVPALFGLEVFEYTPNKVKKTVVGVGHATKEQVGKMVQVLLGGVLEKKDAADALAIAICHAHCSSSLKGKVAC